VNDSAFSRNELVYRRSTQIRALPSCRFPARRVCLQDVRVYEDSLLRQLSIYPLSCLSDSLVRIISRLDVCSQAVSDLPPRHTSCTISVHSVSELPAGGVVALTDLLPNHIRIVSVRTLLASAVPNFDCAVLRSR